MGQGGMDEPWVGEGDFPEGLQKRAGGSYIIPASLLGAVSFYTLTWPVC